MSSSRECLERVVGSQTTLKGKRLYIGVACVKWPGDDAYNLLETGAETVLAAAFRPVAAGSLEHILLAAILAYEARAAGRGIARKPGIDIVLHLLGERNIRKAVEKAKPGSEAVVVVVSESQQAVEELMARVERLGLTRCCLDCGKAVEVQGLRLPVETACRYLVTRTAVFAATHRL